MRKQIRAGVLAGFTAVAALAAPGAGAHHAMDSATPATLFEGFVSGLAHPVIGVDHLLFVVAMGAAAYWLARGAGTIFAFLVAALVGTALHLYEGGGLPYADAWVALSLVVLGALLLRGHGMLRSAAAPAFFAVAGIAHGYAYAESIVGAEATPLMAYFAGFTLVQLAIAGGGYALARALARGPSAFAPPAALGGALSLAGAAFLLAALT